MKKDIYIEALEYGRRHLLDGVTRGSFKAHMESLGYKFEDKASELNLYDIFNAVFGCAVGGGHAGIDRNHMDMDAYFSYIEHQELMEARSSANRATLIAILAIILSLATSGFSIWQSSKPTLITEAQFKRIESLKYDSSNLEVLLKKSIDTSTSNNSETIKLLEEILNEMKSNKALQPTQKPRG